VALRRLGSKLEAWQVRALFLGVQASPNRRLGPQVLLRHLGEGDRCLGLACARANADLPIAEGAWNALVADRGQGRARLSQVRIGKPASRSDLVALAERRADEIASFVRGIEAGGADLVEFGKEGQEVLRRLREIGMLCTAMRNAARNQRRPSAAALTESARALAKAKTTAENLIDQLMTICDDARRHVGAQR
jgi:hypothetical protein